MANFGKIVLFRIEDLLPENNDNAYYPKSSAPQSLFNGGEAFPFIDAGITVGEPNGPAQYNLDYTSRKWYRILGKNYKLENGSLKSVIYSTLSLSGEETGNPNAGGIGVPNYFDNFESLGSEPSQQFPTKATDDIVNPSFALDDYYFTRLVEAIETLSNAAHKSSDFYTRAVHDEPVDKRPGGFINHNLSLPKPLMSNQSVTSLDQYGIGDSIKIKSIYNYYLKDYENFYRDVTKAGMTSIPNFYYLVSLLNSPETFADVTQNLDPTEVLLRENAGLGGAENIPFTMEGILRGVLPSSPASSMATAPLGSKLATEIIFNEYQLFDKDRATVVVVTPSFYKTLSNEIKTQKKAHPFYNQIEIPIIKGGTVFRDLFKKAKIYEELQYRAGVQIKIINKASSPLIGMAAAGVDISSEYNLFYSNVEQTNEGLQTTYRSLDPFNNFTIPYKPASSDALKGKIVEFDVGFNPDGVRQLKKYTGDPTYINLSDYVSQKGHVYINDGKLNGLGVNFNLSKPNIFTEQVNFVVSPLTFYANAPASENNYIDSALNNKVNSILEFVFNKCKLHAGSVFNNLENYSEILFFEVQKYTMDRSYLIQTFILPNDPDIGDKIEYIDSQVEYGKGYIYEIYAHTISVGNRLRRGGSNRTEDFPGFRTFIGGQPTQGIGKLEFVFNNRLDVKILRVPYHNTDALYSNDLLYAALEGGVTADEVYLRGLKRFVSVIDKPPIPPNITFYPFKNISNKIGFWFNLGLGEIKMVPEGQFLLDTVLADPDQDTAEDVLSTAALLYTQLVNGDITREDYDASKILYKTDDFGGKIEIYRLTEKPESYSDFVNNKISDVDVIGPRTLIDDIVPNQDYYYTFRHVDVHGLPSNPTPVYHFKMITSNSTMEADSVRIGVEGLQPILFNEIIHLNGNSYEEQKVEKSFKKYLLVEPTLSQTYLSFDNFENQPNPVFGTANDVILEQNNLIVGKGGEDFINVKGKKFKIRVTSKQTGRKIDLNVDFKNLSVIENYKE